MQHNYQSNTAFMIEDKAGYEAYQKLLARVACNLIRIYKQTIKSQSKGNRAAIEAYVIAGTDMEKETYVNSMGGFMYD